MKFFKYLLIAIVLMGFSACKESKRSIENIPPKVELGAYRTIDVNRSVTFSADVNDSDGSIVKYVWTKNNEVVSSDENYSYVPTELGEVKLGLTVTDNDGASTTDTLVVLVTRRAFITEWKIDDKKITIPVSKWEKHNLTIEWGDGTFDTDVSTTIKHQYKEEGNYDVRITGLFPRLYFGHLNRDEKDKLIAVKQWGDNPWSVMRGSFLEYKKVKILAKDIPNLSNAKDMAYMFDGASSFNADISNWDVSHVQYMRFMLSGTQISTENYNKLLNSWSKLTLQRDVYLDVNAQYTKEGERARSKLIYDFDWTIEDRGLLGKSIDDENNSYNDKKSFITKWIPSKNKEITIPTYEGEDYNYSVEWGDGQHDNNIKGNITHTYAKRGKYIVKILGKFPQIYFNANCFSDNQNSLVSIEQWGAGEWNSMHNAFRGCMNLKINAKDTPNLSKVKDMSFMFSGTQLGSTGSNLSDWNVSEVTNMSYMFAAEEDQEQYDECLSQFNSFNQDISKWNTSNVTNMQGMFISSAFNQNISNWNVSKVEDMSSMFAYIDTYYEEETYYSPFNQDISSWNVSNVKKMDNMLIESALSTANYDKLLNGWSKRTLQNDVDFSIGTRQYTNDAKESRTSIIENYNWSINDGGMIKE